MKAAVAQVEGATGVEEMVEEATAVAAQAEVGKAVAEMVEGTVAAMEVVATAAVREAAAMAVGTCDRI